MENISTLGPKCGMDRVIGLSQTRPIPRSPDGDKNIGEKTDPAIIILCGLWERDKTMKIPSKVATAMWFPVVGPALPEKIDQTAILYE